MTSQEFIQEHIAKQLCAVFENGTISLVDETLKFVWLRRHMVLIYISVSSHTQRLGLKAACLGSVLGLAGRGLVGRPETMFMTS